MPFTIQNGSWFDRQVTNSIIHVTGATATDGSINLDHYLYGAPKQQP
jgi:hypothetical protein